MPLTDPYRVLGVARNASQSEITAAYERLLNGAASTGDVRRAIDLDAAYTLLRSPELRRTYDETGRIVPVMRQPLHERYAVSVGGGVPHRGVPAPPGLRAPAAARPRRTRREGVTWRDRLLLALILLVLLAAGRWWSSHGPVSSRPLIDDLLSPAAKDVSGPPLVREPRKRLLPEVPTAETSGPYSFAQRGDHGEPVRWDPCQSIRWVLSGTEPFDGANELLRGSIKQVSAATGLFFIDEGATSEPPSAGRSPFQPGRYGQRWAPVEIAWTDAATVPALAGRVAGIGGAASAVRSGHQRYVSGLVFFEAGKLAVVERQVGPEGVRMIMLHELGHLVGLAHVNDPRQVMNPDSQLVRPGGYADGDRHGLAVLGQDRCTGVG